eukprot:EG_transcript_7512
MPTTMLVSDFALRILILGFHCVLKDGHLPQFWHNTQFRRSALLAQLRPEDMVPQNNIATAKLARYLWVQHHLPFMVAMDEALNWAERKAWVLMLELSMNSPLGHNSLPPDFGVSQFTKHKGLFRGTPFLMPQSMLFSSEHRAEQQQPALHQCRHEPACQRPHASIYRSLPRDVQRSRLDTTSWLQPEFAAAPTFNVVSTMSPICGENDEALPRRLRRPLGDPSLPLADSAQQVVPFLQKLLSNGEVCQPAADLGQCSTSAHLVAALNALGMPFRVDEKVLSKAVQVVQSKKKFSWIYRPRPGKGPLQRWTRKREKNSARRTHRGQEFFLYSVWIPALPKKAVDQAPTAAGPSPPLEDERQQCRAYAEALLPAVRHALRQPQGWGHRPPRTLDDCLTTHEFGRRLLALIGPHPSHLEQEAVTVAILKCVVKEGLVHRAGIGEGGAVIAVQRADVARREDEVSGKACQLVFVSSCAVATSTC